MTRNFGLIQGYHFDKIEPKIAALFCRNEEEFFPARKAIKGFKAIRFPRQNRSGRVMM